MHPAFLADPERGVAHRLAEHGDRDPDVAEPADLDLRLAGSWTNSEVMLRETWQPSKDDGW